MSALDSVDPRIEDYLNDKLQTYADFEAVDTLLANVASQQELLRKQLQEAENDLASASSEAAQHETDVHRQTTAFERLQADIDRRLIIITNSDTADEAVDRFEETMTTLRKLDIADNYLQMLQEVERIDQSAREELSNKPETAIRLHADLYQLSQELKHLQQAAEGAAPHLIDYVEQSVTNLEHCLRDRFANDLNEVLEKILWPKKTVALPMSLLEPFNTAVGHLLSLQRPLLDEKAAVMHHTSIPPILYPLEVLVRPLAQRFQYHFSGDRPTNRLDKPEYFFSHFFDVLGVHLDFINDYIQPLLLQHYHGTTLAQDTNCFDATTAFINALLPMVRARVLSIVDAVSQQPQLLSHLVSQLVQVDKTLRNDWHHEPGGMSTPPWRGLTQDILTANNYFDHWLNVEHNFALSRYDVIDSDVTAYALDFDAVSSLTNSSVPTTAALRIHDLLTTITNTYRDLPSFSQRLRFLISIQVDILDRFHSRLHSALEAFLARTSSVGRAVQGVTVEERVDLQGVGGLDRLARVYGSTEYLERAMQDWSDDVFFLQMWNELQVRARDRPGSDVISGPIHVNEIAAKTSGVLGVSENDTEDFDGGLFDETAHSYARLRERAVSALETLLNSAVAESLRPYTKSATFASTDISGGEDNLASSPALAGILQTLSTCLSFLVRALAVAPLRRVIRSMSKEMDEILFKNVVLARDFSWQGAKQFKADITGLVSTMDQALGRKFRHNAIRRSQESALLLTLPVDGEQSGDSEGSDDVLTLWDVEKKLFASNEDARSVLAELGCSSLTEAEARRVLKCRLEVEN